MIGVEGEGGYFLQFLFTCFRTESNTFTAAEGCFEYRGLLILKLKTVRIFVLVLPFAFSIFSSGIFACLPCIFFIIQFNFFQLRVLILCLFWFCAFSFLTWIDFSATLHRSIFPLLSNRTLVEKISLAKVQVLTDKLLSF